MSRDYQHFYDFGPFQVDAVRHILLHKNTPIALTPKAFETLLVLIQNSGRALTKEELLKSIWPDSFVEEATLAQNIFTLRKVFSANVTGGDQYIQTVPKVGYRFVVAVREVKGQSGSFQVEQFGHTEKVVKFEETTDRHREIKSLAVLPLAIELSVPEAEYLSDGITENIVNALSLLPDLNVKACSTVARYKAQTIDPQEVGRELGVDAILIGGILPLGEKIIIKMELVDVANGWQLWGEQYDQSFSELLKIHQAVAKDISDKLCLRLTPREKKRLKKTGTENAEAYRLYLKGRYFLNKRTKESYELAIQAFEQAIEIDSQFSLAYTGVADSYIRFDFYGLIPPWEAVPKAKRAAVKALQFDDELAEAHSSLAAIKLVYDRDPAGAELEFQKAIRLNPKYAPAHNGYAYCLMDLDRVEESLAECRLALELEPLDLETNLSIALHYLFARNYDHAIEQLHRTLEIEPNFFRARFLLGIAYGQKGKFSEAIAEFLHHPDESKNMPVLNGFLGYCYGKAGKIDEARKVLDDLLLQSRLSYVPPYSITLIYTGLGERDKALEWLEKACVEQSRWRSWLKLTPELDSLRSDPKFTEFLLLAGFKLTQF